MPYRHAHAAPPDFGRAFGLGIALNPGFIALEVSFGRLANSMAVLADAGHNFFGVLGLAVAWVAAVQARRPPSARFTYGLRAGSVSAALFNPLFLLAAIGWMGWEGVGPAGGARAGGGGDGGDHDLKRHQRLDRQALRRRAAWRPGHPRRLSSHGGRCRGVAPAWRRCTTCISGR